ncbi:MAG TPA: hypothetical protein VK092_01970 [Deinococcales bacterium]|nr:hypothetical protein [Deinococcales bacterium]
MRIGFLKTLLWSRYGQFWLAVARDAGAEPVFAEPEAVLRHAAAGPARDVPSTAFRLATAEALALAHCDLIIVPDPNYGSESARGAGQDAWVSGYPEALASGSGLRNIFSVPAWLDPSMSDLAVTLLQRLRSDGWRTRMILERHRTRLTPRRPGLPPQARPGTTAVLAQPWLAALEPERLLADGAVGTHFGQSQLPAELLLTEGARVRDGLLRTDTEVLGAVRWFNRRGGFSKLVFVRDDGSGPDDWLIRQAERSSHKPLEVVHASELMSESDWLERLPETSGEV